MADSFVSDTIDQARLDSGLAILELTDRAGFDARAAFWLHDRAAGTWRYFLVTPMLGTQGPKWVYERLLRLFQTFALPRGVSPLDIYVIDEATEMAIFGPPLIAVESATMTLASCITQSLDFDGLSVSDGFAVLLRRLPDAARELHGNPASGFDKTIQMLAA